MKLQNPFTRRYVEYPLLFDPSIRSYQVSHETPFTDRHSEWAVSVIATGDKIYIPCGRNRCRNIYVVTKFYLDGTLKFPQGIYTLPTSYFTTIKNFRGESI